MGVETERQFEAAIDAFLQKPETQKLMRQELQKIFKHELLAQLMGNIIGRYKQEISDLQTRKATLQTEITQLEAQRKKLVQATEEAASDYILTQLSGQRVTGGFSPRRRANP